MNERMNEWMNEWREGGVNPALRSYYQYQKQEQNSLLL